MKKLLIACIVLTATSIPLRKQKKLPQNGAWRRASPIRWRTFTCCRSITVRRRTRALFRAVLQNFEHDSFQVNALTLLLGYRRFIYRGLHLEAEFYPAYNKIHSKVNDKDYPGIEMWGEFKIGYRFDLAGGRLYIQPAPGIGFGFFRTNKPPNFDEEIDYPTFTPQLLVGIRL